MRARSRARGLSGSRALTLSLSLALALSLALMLAISLPAFARGTISGFAMQGGYKTSIGGGQSATYWQKSYPLATVTIYIANTSTLATCYSDAGGTLKSNPFTADIRAWWSVFVDNGAYDVTFSGTGIATPFTLSSLSPSYGASGGGTVTSVSVASANGLAGTVATATTTPAITLSTTVTGVLKGNGTTISAASAGTDYTSPAGVESLSNKTLITPTIASFINATHNHTNAAGGGQLTDAALSSAVTVPKGGSGLTSATLGDVWYASAANTMSALAGNTTTTKTYLSQTGTGVVSAAPLWAQVAAADLSNGTTGSGAVVLATSPTLVTPTLGVASATTINKVTITAPATGSTLTIADGQTLTAPSTATVSGTNTGDQTIALTGDVTGTGTGSFAATIASSAVTNAKMANMAATTIKGNSTGGSATPSDLTTTVVAAMLPAVVGDTGAGGTKGLVPAPGAGDAAASKYLKADGTWATPSGSGSGTVTSVSVVTANGLAGTVATATTTPAITLSTTVTGVLKGNGTAISAAAAGTDYTSPAGTENLTNKTLDNTNTVTLKQSKFTLQDATDTTKQLTFVFSGITTATTRTLTWPDISDTAVTLTATQTLTNKTLTTPTIGSFTNATHNHTNAAGGGQLTDAALSSAVTVPKGGTGVSALTAYAPVFGGTTTTGVVQSGTVGTSGQVLTSNGAGALPTFQAAAGAPGVWTAFTPSIGGVTSPTTDTARYLVTGKLMYITWKGSFTGGGASGSMTIPGGFTAKTTTYVAPLVWALGSAYGCGSVTVTGTGNLTFDQYNAGTGWASGGGSAFYTGFTAIFEIN